MGFSIRCWSKRVETVVLIRMFVAMGMLSMPCSFSWAQATVGEGQIQVLSAQLRDYAQGWHLSAEVDISLSREIRQGLESGVPLHFIVEFRIKKPRPLWPDKTLLAVRHRYSLIYYELTRHYRLQLLSTKESRNYRSLLSALDDLGNIQGLFIDRPSEFEYTEPLNGHMNVRLDDKALPLPLQPLFSSTWRLSSEEFAWSLN